MYEKRSKDLRTHKHGAIGPCRTTLQRDPEENNAPDSASCTNTVQSEPQQKYAAEWDACTNTVQSEQRWAQPMRKRWFMILCHDNGFGIASKGSDPNILQSGIDVCPLAFFPLLYAAASMPPRMRLQGSGGARRVYGGVGERVPPRWDAPCETMLYARVSK